MKNEQNFLEGEQTENRKVYISFIYPAAVDTDKSSSQLKI